MPLIEKLNQPAIQIQPHRLGLRRTIVDDNMVGGSVCSRLVRWVTLRTVAACDVMLLTRMVGQCHQRPEVRHCSSCQYTNKQIQGAFKKFCKSIC